MKSLVLALTGSASQLGPNISGFLTPFPTAATIIAVFTHAQYGSKAVVTFLDGFLLALNCFAVFCLVFAIGLQPWGIVLAVAAALSMQLLVQGIILLRMTGRLNIRKFLRFGSLAV